MRLTVIALIAAWLLAVSSFAAAASPYSQDWAVQFGTTGHEGIRTLAVDSAGRYYVADYRDKEDPAAGYRTYLQQFEPIGAVGWLRQPSGPLGEADLSQAMTILDDRVYFVTRAKMNVAPELHSFDATGAFHSVTIQGFPPVNNVLAPFSLAADADGNVVIGGIEAIEGDFSQSPQAFVAKINNSGQTNWVRTNVFSSDLNGAGYVAVDAQGSIYVAGASSAQDVQLEKFDAHGAHLWSRTFGSPLGEVVYDIILDAGGHPLIIGTTNGDFGGPSAGLEDAFVLNVTPNGELDWVTQFGGPGYERAYGVDVAPNGHIFVGGHRLLSPGHVADLSYTDAIWTELDSNGSQLWIDEIGTVGNSESIYEVLVDDNGDVLLGGQTGGSLFAPHIGTYGHDAFVLKFNVNTVPETATSVLFAIGAMTLCYSTRIAWKSREVKCERR